MGSPFSKLPAPADQVDIIILLNDTPDISENMFSTMHQLCEKICRELVTPNSRIALLSFRDTTCSIVTAFTNDTMAFKKTLSSYHPSNPSSNLPSPSSNPPSDPSSKPLPLSVKCGLDMAQQLFRDEGRSNSHQVAFMIIQSNLHKANALEPISQLLNFTCYGIGVGPWNQGSLNFLTKIASPGCAFHANEIDELINRFHTSDFGILWRQVNIHASIVKGPVKLTDAIDLCVRIKNIGQHVIAAGTTIVVFGGKYYHPVTHILTTDMASNEEQAFEVTVRPTGVSFEVIPNSLTLKLLHPTDVLDCKLKEIPLSSEYFLGSFVNFKPSNPAVKILNILILDPESGENSFVNSLVTALADKVTEPASASNSEGKRRNYRCYSIGDYLTTIPHLPINLWDFFALSDSNHSLKYLPNFLEGTFSQKKIHGVLFEVPAKIESYLIPTIKEALSIIQQKGLQPLIIVTSSKHEQEQKSQIAQILNVQPSSIYFVEKYPLGCRAKNFDIDIFNLHISFIVNFGFIYILYYIMLCYVMLCYVILFYFILFYFILFYFILFIFVGKDINCDNIFAEIIQIADTFASTNIQALPNPPQQIHAANIPKETMLTVKVFFGGKIVQLPVTETTTFESLLSYVAQKAKVNVAEYCIASQQEGGIEFMPKDNVRKTLQAGISQLYMRKDDW